MQNTIIKNLLSHATSFGGVRSSDLSNAKGKKLKVQRFEQSFRRISYIVFAASIVATLLPLAAGSAHAADTIQTLATPYQPVISERIDASGFKHPGIGF